MGSEAPASTKIPSSLTHRLTSRNVLKRKREDEAPETPVSRHLFNALSVISAASVATALLEEQEHFLTAVDTTQGLEHVYTTIGSQTENLFLFEGALNKCHNMSFMFDSGASLLALSKEAAQRAGLRIKPRKGGPIRLKLANRSVETCDEEAKATLKMGGFAHTFTFTITPFPMGVDCILGTPFLKAVDHGDLTLHIATGGISFSQGGKKIQLPPKADPRNPNTLDSAHFQVISADQGWQDIIENMEIASESADPNSLPTPAFAITAFPSDFKEGEHSAFNADTPTLDLFNLETVDTPASPLSESTKLGIDETSFRVLPFDFYMNAVLTPKGKPRTTLEDNSVEDPTQSPDNIYPDVDDWVANFRKTYEPILKEEMGTFNPDSKHTPFVLEVDPPDSKPVADKPRRLGVIEQRKLHEQLTELVNKGYLQRSTSNWAAPVMMVLKPHQTETDPEKQKYRLVCDYRRLNARLRDDTYPLRSCQHVLDEMAGSTVFSVVDCLWGFYQIPTDPATRHRSCITTPYGAYEWLCMPMGTKTSPAHYQRQMDSYLGHLPFVKVFLDDVAIHSATVEQHKDHLNQVFQILLEKGVILKPSKMQLFRKSVSFLGHVISGKGIAVQNSKVKAVQDWPELVDEHEVRRFLGLCNFYRNHVSNFSAKAAPLNRLLRKNAEFRWGEEEKQAS